MTRHALVVDDNRPLAENLAEILAAEGYTVHVYDDPLAALHDSQHLEFELALLDVRMPELDGVALHRRLLEHHPNTQFVLMSAHSEDALIAEALKAGVHSVLTKPVSVPRLLHAIAHGALASREVLLIDDDPAFCAALGEVLVENGYRVQTAPSARDGRALAHAELLAAIVDVRLPDRDGAQLGAELAQALPIRVVLISGYGLEESRLLGEQYGGRVRFLEKPFAPDALLALLGAMQKGRA